MRNSPNLGHAENDPESSDSSSPHEPSDGSTSQRESGAGEGFSVHSVLLNQNDVEVLGETAPEILHSIAGLEHLDAQIRDFERALSDREAVSVLRGLEDVERRLESVRNNATAVLRRLGVPKEFGYATATSMITNEFSVSRREANRRVRNSRRFGAGIGLLGEATAPMYPHVADELHEGRISVDEADEIARAVDALPVSMRVAHREDAELKLLELVPSVEVSDIKVLAKRIVDHLDPDGDYPRHEPRREDYRITISRMRSGDWKLSGLLDGITGSLFHGLVTQRMQLIENAVDSTPDADSAPAAESVPGADSATASAATQQDVEQSRSARKSLAADADVLAAVAAGAGLDPAVSAVDCSDRTRRMLHGTSASENSAEAVPPRRFSVTFGDSSPANEAGKNWPAANDGTRVLEDRTMSEDRTTVPEDDSEFSPTGLKADGSPGDGVPPPQPLHSPPVMYSRFVQLLCRAAAERTRAGAAYALVVTTGRDVYEAGTGACETADGTTVDLEDLTELSNGGQIIERHVDPAGITRQVVTTKRFVDKYQLAVLAARDRGCTFPGCDRPHGACDAHHMEAHRHNPETDLNNLTLVCPYHHHWHEEHGWRAELIGGLPAWIPPTWIDRHQNPVFHSRFRARLIDIPEPIAERATHTAQLPDPASEGWYVSGEAPEDPLPEGWGRSPLCPPDEEIPPPF